MSNTFTHTMPMTQSDAIAHDQFPYWGLKPLSKSVAKPTSLVREMGSARRNRDGQVLPFSNFGTDVDRSEYIEMTGEDKQILNVGYKELSGKPGAFGNDSHDYIMALESSMDETFNDGEFQEAVMTHIFPAEFRPYGIQPTPIRRHALEDRTVTFKYQGAFDPSKDAPTAKAVQGSSVTVTPLLPAGANKSGILVSMATFISDFDMIGGWTEGALQASVINLKDQYCRKMFGSVAKVLAGTPDLQTAHYDTLSGKPASQAEDVLDALALNLPTHLGSALDEFALMVPMKLEAVLDRAAQRAGHEDLSELLGCIVCPYDGDDTGIYLLPKNFAMLSFRSTQAGKTVNIQVTRDSARAGYNFELISVLDVMASGTVSVTTGNFDTQADASFPLVHRIIFDGAKAGGEVSETTE